MKFSEMGLSDALLKAIADKGYDTPTPIQAQGIEAVLKGKDVMAAAQTGTGKTAAFVLPILHGLAKGKPVQHNQARVLILTPTRELAAQVHESVEVYGKYLSLRSAVVFGGVGINPQMKKLRRGVDVLVATPGRLLDLYNQKAVKFTTLEVLVLDEGDRMLDMGFIKDIRKIISHLPKKRQSLLFSATFSDEVRTLAKTIINNPVEISVTPRNTTVDTVEQWLHPVDKKSKSALLTKLINKHKWQQVLVFCRTKHGANRLTKHLEQSKITATAIHGNKSQGARTKALADFKKGVVRVLVATDIAARGIDINQLPQVVNFDLPNVAEDYVHRIGRTGRAGSNGHAFSLVSAEEFKELADIERLIKQVIPRQMIEGFNPDRKLPASRLDLRPKKSKKSKKPKKPKKPKKTKTYEAANTQSRPKTSKARSTVKKSKPQHKPKKSMTQKKEASSGSPRKPKASKWKRPYGRNKK